MSALFDVTAADVADTNDDWYTPRWIFEAAGLTFDMDVAAPVDAARRTCPARTYLTPVEDGLATPWGGGRVVQPAILRPCPMGSPVRRSSTRADARPCSPLKVARDARSGIGRDCSGVVRVRTAGRFEGKPWRHGARPGRSRRRVRGCSRSRGGRGQAGQRGVQREAAMSTAAVTGGAGVLGAVRADQPRHVLVRVDVADRPHDVRRALAVARSVKDRAAQARRCLVQRGRGPVVRLGSLGQLSSGRLVHVGQCLMCGKRGHYYRVRHRLAT